MWAFVQNYEVVKVRANPPTTGTTRSGRIWSGQPTEEMLNDSNWYKVVEIEPEYEPDVFYVGRATYTYDAETDLVEKVWQLLPHEPYFTMDRDYCLADAQDCVTVTLVDGTRNDGDTVTFDVNEEPSPVVTFSDRRASIDIAASGPCKVRIKFEEAGIGTRFIALPHNATVKDHEYALRYTEPRKVQNPFMVATPDHMDERADKVNQVVRRGDFMDRLETPDQELRELFVDIVDTLNELRGKIEAIEDRQ